MGTVINFGVIASLVAVLVVFFFVVILLRRYKRCPSDKVMVIYGKTGKDKDGQSRSAKCIHGGASFVWPVIQDYTYLDLTPISIDVDLRSALSKQNIRVDVPSQFTIAISTKTNIMLNAAERLLGLNHSAIEQMAKDIILGQLRLVIASMEIEDINANRDKFLSEVTQNVGEELNKIGLELINVNVTDIRDESGYIEALGQEAAAKAINEAKVSVAKKNKEGEVGEKDQEKERRVSVAKANAEAVAGENKAKVDIANSEASKREAQSEAEKRATTAEKVNAAQAQAHAYKAEEIAEKAKAEKERAAQIATEVVPAEIEKQKVVIAAEAKASKIKKEAEGEAAAIFAKMEAEAKGINEIYTQQAEGLEKLVKAVGGNPQHAFNLMLVDKLPKLVEMQTEAIKSIKIDKITVWDSGSNGGVGNATPNLIKGIFSSVPPLGDLLNQVGLDLPDFLAKNSQQEVTSQQEEIKEEQKSNNKMLQESSEE